MLGVLFINSLINNYEEIKSDIVRDNEDYIGENCIVKGIEKVYDSVSERIICQHAILTLQGH